MGILAASMDTVNAFSALVGNVGVPVACLGVVFWLWYVEMKNHKEEVKSLTESINNNTLVMQKLLDKMEESKNGT